MATQVQFRGGSTAEHGNFNGAAKEVTVDTSKDVLVVHPGTGAGNGVPMFRASGGDQDISTEGNATFGNATTAAVVKAYGVNGDDVVFSTHQGNSVGQLEIEASGNLTTPGTLTATVANAHGAKFTNNSADAWDVLKLQNTNTSVTASSAKLINGQTPSGTDAFSVDLAGAATFTGNIQSGGNPISAAANGTTMLADSGIVATNSNTAVPLWRGYTKDNATATSSITAAGAATFASTIVSGADPYNDQANVGQRMDPSSGIIARSAGSNQLWTGYATGSGTVTSEIQADGDATFKPNSTGEFKWYSNNSVTYVELAGEGEVHTAFGVYDSDNNAYQFRLKHNGEFFAAAAASDSPGDGNNNTGFVIKNSSNHEGRICASSVADHTFNRTTDGTIMSFKSEGSTEGSISISGSTTTYNTSSDYRLKENIVEITDGIDRLKQLKPSRFNFKTKPDKTVDGFVAHEVSSIVPEAITGEKDAMKDEEYVVTPEVDARPAVLDEEGNVVTPAVEYVPAVKETRSVPDYQGIDQAKLTPLLTAALQEAITKIETLETKVAALEAA